MDVNATSGADTTANAGSTGAGSQPSQDESKFEKGMNALHDDMNGKAPNSQELPEKSQGKEEKESGDTPKDDWEKRYKEVHADRDRRVSEYEKRVEEMALERISEQPEYVHTLAKKDRPLVDRIIAKDPECQKEGIRNYDDLMAYAQKQNMPEEQKAVLDKVTQLEEKVNQVETKLSKEEQKQVELFYTQFREQHPEFKGEVEKKTLELFNKTELTLDECLDYVKWKEGISEDRNQIEEKIVRDLESKKVAEGISSGDARVSGKGKGKQLNTDTVNFLEGIGATKTLEKHGYNS